MQFGSGDVLTAVQGGTLSFKGIYTGVTGTSPQSLAGKTVTARMKHLLLGKVQVLNVTITEAADGEYLVSLSDEITATLPQGVWAGRVTVEDENGETIKSLKFPVSVDRDI